MKITKEMSIAGTIRRYPAAIEVFKKYHMECLACMGADAESIENGALMHGLDPDEIIRELNRAAGEPAP